MICHSKTEYQQLKEKVKYMREMFDAVSLDGFNFDYNLTEERELKLILAYTNLMLRYPSVDWEELYELGDFEKRRLKPRLKRLRRKYNKEILAEQIKYLVGVSNERT